MRNITLMKEAMREVKRLSKDLDSDTKIYLAFNKQHGDYFVSDNYDEISEAIYARWFESAFENDADKEAEKYTVWDYSLASNKEKYPNTYHNARKSLIRSELPMVRKSNTVNAHYSVQFKIN